MSGTVVYVLVECENYEGGHVEGLFSTRDRAKEALDLTVSRRGCTVKEDGEENSRKGLETWSVYRKRGSELKKSCNYYSIYPMTVDDKNYLKFLRGE